MSYYTRTALGRYDLARAESVNAEFAAIEAAFEKLPAEVALATGAATWAATVSGGPNAYVLTLPKTATAYADGMVIFFAATAANTGAMTVNVDSLGVKEVVSNVDSAAIAATAVASGAVVGLVYSGTKFRMVIPTVVTLLEGTNALTLGGEAGSYYLDLANHAGDVPDATFRIADNGDPTKKLAFEVGTNVSTGTTRTLTLPAANGEIARRIFGTDADLSSANAVIPEGQWVFTTDTAEARLGDGSAYNDTDPFNPGSGLETTSRSSIYKWPTIAAAAGTIDDTFLNRSLSLDSTDISADAVVTMLGEEGSPANAITLDLDFGASDDAGPILCRVPDDQTGLVTLRSATYATTGLIDGRASRTFKAPQGFFAIFREAGATQSYRTTLGEIAVVQAVDEVAPAAVNWTGTPTLDLKAGAQTFTLTGNVTSITLSNRPADGYKRWVSFSLVQDGTGSRTVAWPSAWKWPNGTEVDPTAAAGSRDDYTLEVSGSAGDVVIRSAGSDIKTA